MRRAGVCLAALLLLIIGNAAGQQSAPNLELSRPIRSWEFLPVVGTRAALLGDETGKFEAWIYPLKLFRNLHLVFHVEDRALPAESLARTLTVRPDSASILYVGDSFRVRETLCVPFNESGAVILLDVETESPLEVEAGFTADFQLEWPGSLGGTYVDWDLPLHAFVFADEAHKYAGLLGSPTGADARLEYETNYSSSTENSFRLGVTQKGKERKILIVAGSVLGLSDAEKTYHHLADSYERLMQASGDYYRSYLANTVTLDLPDRDLQQAYDWARISTIQGLVNNPYLGSGLVAGYRPSGASQRPGFAWFFGRDSFWTAFALDAEEDYTTARAAIDFISRFQRADGKIPHEISQSATLVPWFKDYPYAYASADATPLFVIATDDYATRSGDVDFVREKWDCLWRAYQFLRSTYDPQGLAQNIGVGHGWIEGGPLLPVKNEYYQSGLGVEALRALSRLAHFIGKDDIARQLSGEFDHTKSALEQAFWSPENNDYSYALNQDNQRMDETSVLTAVPMWFGLSDASHANATITQLTTADLQTDWGMRIISQKSKSYDGSGYHFGSVWPLFTGWASVAEYRYHRADPAYFDLRVNALLGLEGSLGHFTEVLSGDYYSSFATSSPHQIWSAAMVISPILRGMFGLETDAEERKITLAPHVPSDWNSFAVRNVRVGKVTADFAYRKTPDMIVLETKRSGDGDCTLEFSPAISLGAHVISVEMNGRPLPFKLDTNTNDQHISIHFPIYNGPNTLTIRLKNNFGISVDNELPPIGSTSHALRVLSESWNTSRTQLDLQLSGLAGSSYEMNVFNPGLISSVQGATLTREGKLQVQFADTTPGSYEQQRVSIHLGQR